MNLVRFTLAGKAYMGSKDPHAEVFISPYHVIALSAADIAHVEWEYYTNLHLDSGDTIRVCGTREEVRKALWG